MTSASNTTTHSNTTSTSVHCAPTAYPPQLTLPHLTPPTRTTSSTHPTLTPGVVPCRIVPPLIGATLPLHSSLRPCSLPPFPCLSLPRSPLPPRYGFPPPVGRPGRSFVRRSPQCAVSNNHHRLRSIQSSQRAVRCFPHRLPDGARLPIPDRPAVRLCRHVVQAAVRSADDRLSDQHCQQWSCAAVVQLPARCGPGCRHVLVWHELR